MGLIFTPSTPMPAREEVLESMVWYCVWDRPWNSHRLLARGSTVFLYDAGREVVRWETELTEVLAVPFESSDSFRDHVRRKWGQWVTPLGDDGPLPGWGVAWRARAVRRVDVTRPVGSPPLEQWTPTCTLDDGWRRALGIDTESGGSR